LHESIPEGEYNDSPLSGDDADDDSPEDSGDFEEMSEFFSDSDSS
jgi:hypothetical protein